LRPTLGHIRFLTLTIVLSVACPPNLLTLPCPDQSRLVLSAVSDEDVTSVRPTLHRLDPRVDWSLSENLALADQTEDMDGADDGDLLTSIPGLTAPSDLPSLIPASVEVSEPARSLVRYLPGTLSRLRC
jgi:hypothetical protein